MLFWLSVTLTKLFVLFLRIYTLIFILMLMKKKISYEVCFLFPRKTVLKCSCVLWLNLLSKAHYFNIPCISKTWYTQYLQVIQCSLEMLVTDRDRAQVLQGFLWQCELELFNGTSIKHKLMLQPLTDSSRHFGDLLERDSKAFELFSYL